MLLNPKLKEGIKIELDHGEVAQLLVVLTIAKEGATLNESQHKVCNDVMGVLARANSTYTKMVQEALDEQDKITNPQVPTVLQS